MDQPSRTVALDDRLYPAEAFTKAVEAYAEYCDVTPLTDGSPRIVTITPRDGTPASTVDEFLGYMLGAALELHLQPLPGPR